MSKSFKSNKKKKETKKKTEMGVRTDDEEKLLTATLTKNGKKTGRQLRV